MRKKSECAAVRRCPKNAIAPGINNSPDDPRRDVSSFRCCSRTATQTRLGGRRPPGDDIRPPQASGKLSPTDHMVLSIDYTDGQGWPDAARGSAGIPVHDSNFRSFGRSLWLHYAQGKEEGKEISNGSRPYSLGGDVASIVSFVVRAGRPHAPRRMNPRRAGIGDSRTAVRLLSNPLVRQLIAVTTNWVRGRRQASRLLSAVPSFLPRARVGRSAGQSSIATW